MPDQLTPDSYMSQQQAPALTPDSFMQAQAPAVQPFQGAEVPLNYHTGYTVADIPLGLVQGAVKGVLSTAMGAQDIIRKVSGQPSLIPQEDRDALTKPKGVGQGTGKFLEQAAEFALPEAEVADAVKGAGFLARTAAKGATSGAVAGLQSGGDPVATAVGTGLGAGSEVLSGVRALAALPKAPNLQNFSDAFAAIPQQKEVIGKAIPLLVRDGIRPADNPIKMKQAIDQKIEELGRTYEANKAAGIDALPANAETVLDGLKRLQSQFSHGEQTLTKEVPSSVLDESGRPVMKTVTSTEPFVSSEHQQYFNQIQRNIDDVQAKLKAQDGQISYGDLRYFRDGVNGKTNWNSPDAERNLYEDVGHVFRGAMDDAAPGTADLNRSYATYSNLQKLADKNIGYGRGITQSGFDKGIEKGANREIGAALGGLVGHATHIPGGEFLGAMIGGAAYPKMAAPVVQALKNAQDAGVLDKLSAPTKAALRAAVQTGDSGRILSLLGAGATRETLTKAVSQ